MKITSVLGVGLFLATAIVDAAAQQPNYSALSGGAYRLIDLGPEIYNPADINSAGVVVGGRWLFDRQTGLRELPPQRYGSTDSIQSINNAGEFVGIGGIRVNGPGSPCLGVASFAFGGGISVPSDFSLLFSISDNGNLAGSCDALCSGLLYSYSACVSVAGNVQRVVPLVENQVAQAIAINDAGEAAINTIQYASNLTRYFAFRLDSDGVVISLGDLGFGGVSATGINSSGTIVGNAEVEVNGVRAVHPFLARKGEAMVDLGGVDGYGAGYNQEVSINDAEELVGWRMFGESIAGHYDQAFYYSASEGMRSLNELLPVDSAYYLDTARGINNQREIIGTLESDTLGITGHGYILTTQPNPAIGPSFDSDRTSEQAIFRPSEGFWYIRRSGEAFVRQWGLPGDVPMRGDFDGDGILDLVVYRPANGFWWLCSSSTSFQCAAGTGVQFGLPGDLPLNGDFDGDSKSDPAVYRALYQIGHGRNSVQIEGQWYIAASTGNASSIQWGLRDDLPVPEDYDGDGKSDIAVFRPSSGTWYIVYSSKDYSKAAGDYSVVQFGLPEDHPMPADYDGDGRADLAVWRPSSGEWYRCSSIRNFDCSPLPDYAQPRYTQNQFGLPGDTPVRGDFDGDQTYDLAVWREQLGLTIGTWFNISPARVMATSVQWGLVGDVPIGIGVKKLREMIPRN